MSNNPLSSIHNSRGPVRSPRGEATGALQLWRGRTIAWLLMLLLPACSGKDSPVAPVVPVDSGTTEIPFRGDDTFGAEVNPTGNPIGGGLGYTRIVTQWNHLVTTRQELLDALQAARSGETVYVADSTQIDLTGLQNIVIPAGVTLASGRGNGGSEGALLYSRALETIPLFITGGHGVRVTGLRLRGPDPERRTEQMAELYAAGQYYSIPNSRGIQTVHSNLEVDNCELSAWSHAAVYLMSGSTGHIHHSYMHHNQRSGLGYGVVLNESDGLIEANLFDWCRHHIAGTGRPRTSYEARYNLVLENANSHSFDMHGGADRGDGTDIAGTRIWIHHNTFQAVSVRAIGIRGRPEEMTEIYNNWFHHATPGAAIRQTNATGNVRHYKNQYTPNRTRLD